jgi:protein-S-isoprenylcysteine O-methyltransferase Ste14
MRSIFLKVVGYCLPLVQSVPAWTGLMTLPFAGYVVLLFTNFPINVRTAVAEFLTPLCVLEKVVAIIGLGLLVYSILDLKRKKNQGLVTSGPYRFIRHPQYLGMILMMLASTSWSVWVLTNTFGMGFLTPIQTIGVWVVALLAYIILGYLEEQALTRQFGVAYISYQRQTPFLIPVIKPQKKEITLLSSILIPILLLVGLLVS